MNHPQKPTNEPERLHALAAFDILGSSPEKEYDDITKLASFICNAPVSLITFIDEETEFRKSALGLPRTLSRRDHTFCAHAINTPLEITIVPDARLDERYEDNPSVTGAPKIIFYAGMPLVTAEGFPLGTLCVIDHEPKQLSTHQVEALQNLGNQVVKLLELRKSLQLLNTTHKKMEAYAAQMKAFAQLASHDLKEPARMVNIFMRQLENNYASQLDERARKYIHFATDGAKRMTILIDDLLAYSTIEGLTKAKEEVNVENLLTEVVALLSGVINEKKARVVWSTLPEITAPLMATRLVFQNLLSNALKYQAPGTRPLVTVSATETESHWQFEVQDNGIGIDEEYQKDIFKLFKRLHSKEQYPGTGMGLATCKNIIELMGGTIWVKTADGGGSIFIFTIEKS